MRFNEDDAQELLKTHSLSTDGQFGAKKGNPIVGIEKLLPDALERLRAEVGIGKGNKYHAKKTYSTLCLRMFDSKAEAVYGEELYYRQKAGEIEDLRYQVRFKLNNQPRIRVTIDFAYLEAGKRIYDEVKGVLTRDSRTKYAWLEQSQGVHVNLIKR